MFLVEKEKKLTEMISQLNMLRKQLVNTKVTFMIYHTYYYSPKL